MEPYCAQSRSDPPYPACFAAIETAMEPVREAAPPMAMKVNQFDSSQLEQMVAPKMLLPSKPQGRQLNHIGGREHTDLTSTDAINSQAGVREGLSYRFRSLLQRMGVLARVQGQRYVPLRRSRGGKAEKKEEHEEDSSFLAPIRDALDLLSEDSGRDRQEELEAQLARFFEPLQRYHVLFEALEQLEHEDMPSRKKNAVRRALNGMMSRLVEQHPHEVRKALQETDDITPTVEALSDEMPTSLYGMRFLIGAKAKGNVDTPLTPLTMLKALIKNFGAEKCVQAMTGLRSRMMSGF